MDKYIAFLGILVITNGIGFGLGATYEQKFGQLSKEQAAAIDACAREANVYPESCQIKAVVVTPREEPAPEKAADLLPPPVGMKG
jgi:hypothetical protein